MISIGVIMLNMNDVLLFAHIVGAITSIAYIVFGIALVLIKRGNRAMMSGLAAAIIIYQAVSGGALLVLLPGTSLLAVCGKGILLIGAVAMVNYALGLRLAYERSK